MWISLCFINALFYSVLFGVITTLSTAFEEFYPFLTTSTIGLSFLACGGAMTVASVASGRVLDREYQVFKRRIGTESKEVFPIERARLRLLPLVAAVLTIAVAGYGWALQMKAHLVVPLVLNVFSQLYWSFCLCSV